jgi:thiamine biosynthesis lipoprotein
MSFHQLDSDVSRLNREAHRHPTRVGPHTFAVLELAQVFAEMTDGIFDITTASQLVEWGVLPKPQAPPTSVEASWRDIELGSNRTIRFRRPLLIDLGGVAKGYAVDCAIDSLTRHGVQDCCVNAGGDLRVTGPSPEHVRLRTGNRGGVPDPVLELQNGSLASSGGTSPDAARTAHLDGRSRRPVGQGTFACVVAESCAVADALTKIVLAQGQDSTVSLQKLGATAYLLGAGGQWQCFGTVP